MADVCHLAVKGFTNCLAATEASMYVQEARR